MQVSSTPFSSSNILGQQRKRETHSTSDQHTPLTAHRERDTREPGPESETLFPTTQKCCAGPRCAAGRRCARRWRGSRRRRSRPPKRAGSRWRALSRSRCVFGGRVSATVRRAPPPSLRSRASTAGRRVSHPPVVAGRTHACCVRRDQGGRAARTLSRQRPGGDRERESERARDGRGRRREGLAVAAPPGPVPPTTTGGVSSAGSCLSTPRPSQTKRAHTRAPAQQTPTHKTTHKNTPRAPFPALKNGTPLFRPFFAPFSPPAKKKTPSLPNFRSPPSRRTRSTRRPTW